MTLSPDIIHDLRHEAYKMDRSFICQTCKKLTTVDLDDFMRVHLSSLIGNPGADITLEDTLLSYEYCKECIA